MRLIFKILLGLIIFNALLVMTSNVFTYESTGVSGENITGGTTYTSFKNMSLGEVFLNFIIISGGVFGITLVVSFFGSNAPLGQMIGAGSVIAIITGLWGSLTQPFQSLTAGDPYVSQIYNLFIICVGIVAVMSVIEIFTGKGDVD
jgi:hypothetical protein